MRFARQKQKGSRLQALLVLAAVSATLWAACGSTHFVLCQDDSRLSVEPAYQPCCPVPDPIGSDHDAVLTEAGDCAGCTDHPLLVQWETSPRAHRDGTSMLHVSAAPAAFSTIPSHDGALFYGAPLLSPSRSPVHPPGPATAPLRC